MSLIRKHGAVLQAWACLDLVVPRIRMSQTAKKIDEFRRNVLDRLTTVCAILSYF